jgi:hypothetical protein
MVQKARIAAGIQAAHRAADQRNTPALVNIVPMFAGLLVSGGVALGAKDFETACRRMASLAAEYFEDRGRDFAAELSARRLEFGPSSPSRFVGNVRR